MAKASVLDQTEVRVTDLSDEEVLALSNLMMDEDQQEEFSELATLQQEGEIDEAGRERLGELLQAYDRALLLKSEALKVAVERGLRPRFS